MAEDLPITHARLDLIVERLAAMEQALEDLETTLVVVVERLNQLAALYRTDHHGVGRGGMSNEP